MRNKTWQQGSHLLHYEEKNRQPEERIIFGVICNLSEKNNSFLIIILSVACISFTFPRIPFSWYFHVRVRFLNSRHIFHGSCSLKIDSLIFYGFFQI